MAVYRGVAENLVELYEFDWSDSPRLKETCICSVEMVCANIVNIGIVATIALLLQIPAETFMFVVTFAAMRFYAGGVHAKNYARCIVTYICVLLISIYCAKLCVGVSESMMHLVCCGCLLIAGVVSYKYAAKENGVKDKIPYYRRKTFSVLSIVGAVLLMLFIGECLANDLIIKNTIREFMIIQAFALITHSISLYLARKKGMSGKVGVSI